MRKRVFKYLRLSCLAALGYTCIHPVWSAEGDGPKNSVPPGFRVIEGDILVRDNSSSEENGPNQPSSVYSTNFWPGGVVPFEFDSNVITANRTLMLAAMAEWEAVANVDFRPRDGESDFLHIQHSVGNNSSVGRIVGEQFVNIVSWNSRFIMAHELGHALGFWHQQSRSDRDSFIEIHLKNVEEGKEHNFDKLNQASHYGAYDFDSVMHYDQFAFSINRERTIVVRPPNDVQWQNAIGQRDHLSYWDRRVMSFLYPESNWRFLATSGPFFPSGSFLSPFTQLGDATNSVPAGGTIWIGPGTYGVGLGSNGLLTKAMTLRSAIGGVIIDELDGFPFRAPDIKK